jgi:ComF family protein
MKRISSLQILKNIFFPPACASCGELIDPSVTDARSLALCERCATFFASEKSERCEDCGCEIRLCTCSAEYLEKKGIDRLVKLVNYVPKRTELVSSKLLYKIKRSNNRAYFDFLAAELKGRISFELALLGESDDVVFTYAPRSRSALSEHGHDQARLLSRACADALGFERGTHCKRLIRRVSGLEQKNLDAKEREKNMQKAYRLDKKQDVKGKTVIIVDDIVTSGASMARCAEIVLDAGAERVLCVAVAKSQKK